MTITLQQLNAFIYVRLMINFYLIIRFHLPAFHRFDSINRFPEIVKLILLSFV